MDAKRPHGLKEIRAFYGEPPADETERLRWEIENLSHVPFPYPVPLSWCNGRAFGARVHKLLRSDLESIFDDLRPQWGAVIIDFGGGYNPRQKRGAHGPSVHTYGAALDFNVAANPLGVRPTQPAALIEAFTRRGWIWGGTWARPDGMHFQYAEGY